MLKILLIGPMPLVSWSSGSLSWAHFTGLLVVWILGLVVFLMWTLLILCEIWAGERLSLEKAHPRCLRPGRPISVSAVPVGPGIDIWRSCRFIGAMMRSLCLLPGGLGGLYLALLVLIIADFGMLVGRGVVMGLLLVLRRVPLAPF